MRKEEKNIFKTGRKVHLPLCGCQSPLHHTGWDTLGLRPGLHAPCVRCWVCPFVAIDLSFLIRCPLAPLSCCVINVTLSPESPHQSFCSGCTSLLKSLVCTARPFPAHFLLPCSEAVWIGRDVVGVGWVGVPDSWNLASWLTGPQGGTGTAVSVP